MSDSTKTPSLPHLRQELLERAKTDTQAREKFLETHASSDSETIMRIDAV